MLMTKKKANRLIKEAYDEGVDQGYEAGLEVGHERGYGEGLMTDKTGVVYTSTGLYQFDDNESKPVEIYIDTNLLRSDINTRINLPSHFQYY